MCGDGKLCRRRPIDGSRSDKVTLANAAVIGFLLGADMVLSVVTFALAMQWRVENRLQDSGQENGRF